MISGKMMGLFIAMLVGALLIFGACAKKPAPPPAPAPAPAPKPAPAPAPAPPAPKHAPTSIMIAAGRPDGSDFAIANAWATFINGDSDWLKASVLATGGMTDSNKLLVEDPAKRKNTITQSTVTYSMEGAEKLWGVKGFEPRVIGAFKDWTYVLATYNEKIKTIPDFKGKTVGVGRLASTQWWRTEMLFEEEGLSLKRGDYKTVHEGVGALADALRDGKVDVAEVTFDYIYPDKFLKGTFLEQLAARGPFYVVGYKKETLEKVSAKLSLPFQGIYIPANAFGPTPSSPIWQLDITAFWMADITMDEDIVYEVTRIMWAHFKDFGRYHVIGEGIREGYVNLSGWGKGEREKWYHPGTLKFFKEKGIPLLTVGEK